MEQFAAVNDPYARRAYHQGNRAAQQGMNWLFFVAGGVVGGLGFRWGGEWAINNSEEYKRYVMEANHVSTDEELAQVLDNAGIAVAIVSALFSGFWLAQALTNASSAQRNRLRSQGFQRQ